jgi:hypothetical protein
MNMKKIIAIVVIVLTTFAIAAPASASTTAWSRNDYQYVALVRDEAPAFWSVPARQLISLARSICGALDTGEKASSTVRVGVSSGMTRHQALVIVSSAITYYCPWQGGNNIR